MQNMKEAAEYDNRAGTLDGVLYICQGGQSQNKICRAYWPVGNRHSTHGLSGDRLCPFSNHWVINVLFYFCACFIYAAQVRKVKERKHWALRSQKPLRLIRDGEVGGSGIYI